MNPVQLIRPDTKEPTSVWACGECNRTTHSPEIARFCCGPCRTCGAKHCDGWSDQCAKCKSKSFLASERAKLKAQAAEASRFPNYKGWVYSDDFKGSNDGYFESARDFMEEVYQEMDYDPHLNPPDYVWGTISRPIVNISLDDVLNLITEDRPENWSTDDLNGVGELQSALTEFNTSNPKLMYEPDRTTIVPLQWDVKPPKKKIQPPPLDPDAIE